MVVCVRLQWVVPCAAWQPSWPARLLYKVWAHCWPPSSWVMGPLWELKPRHMLPGYTWPIYHLILSSSSLILRMPLIVSGEINCLRLQDSSPLKFSPLSSLATRLHQPSVSVSQFCHLLRVFSKVIRLVLSFSVSPSTHSCSCYSRNSEFFIWMMGHWEAVNQMCYMISSSLIRRLAP